MSQDTAQGRWATDPFGEHLYRYWDGSSWTDLVTDDDPAAQAQPPGAAVPAPRAGVPGSPEPQQPAMPPYPLASPLSATPAPPPEAVPSISPFPVPASYRRPFAHPALVSGGPLPLSRAALRRSRERARGKVRFLSRPLSRRAHVLLAVLTLGLWLLLMPAVML